MSIERVAVGGGGQMGNGIGQVAAVAGLDVTLVDVSQADLDRERRPASSTASSGWCASRRS